MRARLKEWRRLSSKGAHVILGVAPGPAAVVAAPEIAARHSGPLQPLAPVPVPEEGHRLRLRFGAAAGERLQGRGAEMRVQSVQSVQSVQRVQRVPRVPRASGEGAARARGGRLLQRRASLHRGMCQLQRRNGLLSLQAIGMRAPLQWPGSGVSERGRG